MGARGRPILSKCEIDSNQSVRFDTVDKREYDQMRDLKSSASAHHGAEMSNLTDPISQFRGRQDGIASFGTDKSEG